MLKNVKEENKMSIKIAIIGAGARGMLSKFVRN